MNRFRLTDTERSDLRRTLAAHAASNPPRRGMAGFMVRHSLAGGVAAVVLLAGASGAVACWRSQPGDALYGLKTTVSDRVALVTAPDDYARLDLELAQIARAMDDEERMLDRELVEEPDAVTPVPTEVVATPTPAMTSDTQSFRELDDELDDLERELKRAASEELEE